MPSARLDARNITLDGFTETGGGFSALNWDEIEQKSLLANLGASWRHVDLGRRSASGTPIAGSSPPFLSRCLGRLSPAGEDARRGIRSGCIAGATLNPPRRCFRRKNDMKPFAALAPLPRFQPITDKPD